MASLSEYSNVYNTALLILQEKGYQLWYDEPADLYYAEKDGWDFAANTPCGLLGVVAIYESANPPRYADYWWRKDGPQVYRSLPRQPSKEYVPVYERKARGGET